MKDARNIRHGGDLLLPATPSLRQHGHEQSGPEEQARDEKQSLQATSIRDSTRWGPRLSERCDLTN